MLLSMTGHGRALVQDDQQQVLVEVRTVNNRFLKTNISCDLDPERFSMLESMVKKHIVRGSVSLKVNSERIDQPAEHKLNLDVIRAYQEQLSQLDNDTHIELSSLLMLPGVVNENAFESDPELLWPLVEKAATEALANLIAMRTREGQIMADDLAHNCQLIESELAEIKKLAPRVIENYSKKITDRINGLLEKYDVSIEATDVVREVGVFAERVDISEEVVRLGSHIKQFGEILSAEVSNGRKLDFLTQEMLRETNTIGSKANDAGIANHVVEIKSAIERIREMVQNVE